MMCFVIFMMAKRGRGVCTRIAPACFPIVVRRVLPADFYSPSALCKVHWSFDPSRAFLRLPYREKNKCLHLLCFWFIIYDAAGRPTPYITSNKLECQVGCLVQHTTHTMRPILSRTYSGANLRIYCVFVRSLLSPKTIYAVCFGKRGIRVGKKCAKAFVWAASYIL